MAELGPWETIFVFGNSFAVMELSHCTNGYNSGGDCFGYLLFWLFKVAGG